MFDIGFWELIIVLIVALLVIGPERLPRAAQAIGRWTGRAKGMAKQFRMELEREANAAGISDQQTDGVAESLVKDVAGNLADAQKLIDESSQAIREIGDDAAGPGSSK